MLNCSLALWHRHMAQSLGRVIVGTSLGLCCSDGIFIFL